MKGFQNVLVPLDFSHSSAVALETAARVLSPGGRVLLLHVVEWVPSMMEGTFGMYPQVKQIEALHAESEAKLREYAAAHPGLRIDVEVIEGKAMASILEVAEREKSDLIVIGSRGKTALDHLLLGSVAERVLRKAPCPVLTVRE